MVDAIRRVQPLIKRACTRTGSNPVLTSKVLTTRLIRVKCFVRKHLNKVGGNHKNALNSLILFLYCGVDWRRCQLGLISPTTRVRFPPPLPIGLSCTKVGDLHLQWRCGEFDSHMVHKKNASIVKRYNNWFVINYSWFDSEWGLWCNSNSGTRVSCNIANIV